MWQLSFETMMHFWGSILILNMVGGHVMKGWPEHISASLCVSQSCEVPMLTVRSLNKSLFKPTMLFCIPKLSLSLNTLPQDFSKHAVVKWKEFGLQWYWLVIAISIQCWNCVIVIKLQSLQNFSKKEGIIFNEILNSGVKMLNLTL